LNSLNKRLAKLLLQRNHQRNWWTKIMAEEDQLEQKSRKKSKLPLLIGLGLMLTLGGGAFFAVYSGMLLAQPGEAEDELPMLTEGTAPPLPNVAFVPIEPLIINLSNANTTSRHLRFQAQLEVPFAYEQEIMSLQPRIIDVLNGYLRAVDVAELESPAALVRLRAQMLRRLQIVAGEGRIKDVLIMEFVIN
jgi:flagellar FliL protein